MVIRDDVREVVHVLSFREIERAHTPFPRQVLDANYQTLTPNWSLMNPAPETMGIRFSGTHVVTPGLRKQSRLICARVGDHGMQIMESNIRPADALQLQIRGIPECTSVNARPSK